MYNSYKHEMQRIGLYYRNLSKVMVIVWR